MADLIDCYVSQAHYEEHISPIMAALPDEIRGHVYAPRPVARELGAHVRVGTAPNSTMPLLVGGYQDLTYSIRPKVLVQHGAGQTYRDVASPSFAGGPCHEAADLFICPSRRVADLEAARYPGKRYAVVGCPKLDQWATIPRPGNRDPVVAVTFHWDQHHKTVDDRPVPEAGWAWPDWRDVIEELARRWPGRVLGHCHPRARRSLEAWWRSIGVEYVPHAVDLLGRADVLALDNSSLGFEWAALDRPTVWLRGEAWADVSGHGPPRFGHEGTADLSDPGPPGIELGRGSMTVYALAHAVEASRDPRFRPLRVEVTGRVYDSMVDGHASERAAAAVLDLAENMSK